MDNVDFCETPLSLYSYGAMPTKQDIPYAGAGLETNTDNGTSNQKTKKLTSNDVMSKKSVATIKSGSNTSSLSTVRPRSNSSSSARTPIFVAPKKTTMKTVAFGLTTNIEDTVEKSRATPITKKLSVFCSNSNNFIAAPSKCLDLSTNKTDDELLKVSNNELELLKKENSELKKSIIEINSNASNLRQIVINISTRLLELENHKNDYSKSMLELQLSLESNVKTQTSPAYSGNSKAETNDQPVRRTRQTEDFTKVNNDGEVKDLLVAIENSIRNNPNMLRRAKELFGVPQILKPSNDPNPELLSKFNMMTSLNYDNAPKVAQCMTVQRSELITYASPRHETNALRNRNQRPFSNGDDVFFESAIKYGDNCGDDSYFDENEYTNYQPQIEQNHYRYQNQTVQQKMNQTESRIERRERYRRK